MWEVVSGDCRGVMRSLPPECVDACVCDPPYEIGLMGKDWDSSGVATDPATWREVLRVLKPGGHLVAFSASRTYHRIAAAIEAAGFEVRDQILWLYGTGMPKSEDIAKALDKKAGIWRGRSPGPVSENRAMGGPNYARVDKGEPVTELAKKWAGWGTALKPAHEPAILARRPLGDWSVVESVALRGTGALNVGACEIEGRWPTNVAVAEGVDAGGKWFYCPKPSREEREHGCEQLPLRTATARPGETEVGFTVRTAAGVRNHHASVKPVNLMRWLVRLVAPRGGLVLDLFCGSGTTGVAALLEGMDFLGCEMQPDYHEVACARIAQAERDAQT